MEGRAAGVEGGAEERRPGERGAEVLRAQDWRSGVSKLCQGIRIKRLPEAKAEL